MHRRTLATHRQMASAEREHPGANHAMHPDKGKGTSGLRIALPDPALMGGCKHAGALAAYPDPRMVLGPLYEGEGLFE